MPQAIQLTAEDVEHLRVLLKQINLKAKRLQRSTSAEMSLLRLQARFNAVLDYVGQLKKQVLQNRTELDREWRNCRQIEISEVRGFIVSATGQTDFEPVAQNELNALMTVANSLDDQIENGNWGEAWTQCKKTQDSIILALIESRRVTNDEILFLASISDNL